MRRQAMAVLTVGWLILGMLATGGRALAAVEVSTLKAVTASASPSGQELVLRVDGPYIYKAAQAAPDTIFIDLVGTKASGVPRSGFWSNPLLSGYKLLQFQDASGLPVTRVQVDTKRLEPFVVERDGAALRLLFGKTTPGIPAVAASPSPEPAAPRAPESAPAASPASASGPVVVSKVTLDKGQTGETYVDVATSRTVTYHVMTLKTPARLVVDIEGAENTSRQKSYTADTPLLRDVRIAQFREKTPAVVRIVADLNGDPAYDVHATPQGVRIELRPRGMATPAVAAVKAPVPAPEVRMPEAKPAPAVEAAVIPVKAAPVTVTPALAPAAEVIARPAAVTLPLRVETRDPGKPDIQSALPTAEKGARQLTAAPLPAAPSETPEALRAEMAARTLTTGKEAEPLAAQATVPGSLTTPGQEAPVYTGEPISLNLKDVDLKDFFRLIHEISGLNIIVDPNVNGAVTLVLDSVPWDQALDIVLKNNRLGKVLEGNVLRIAQLSTLTAEQESVTKLAAARMDAAPLVSIFRPINYAKAPELAALLKTWTGGGALSRRGTVLVDTRANTLIISDVQSQIPIILSILAKLDTKAKQVSIEARVVLATANFTRTLSSSLAGGFFNNHTTTSAGTGGSTIATIPVPTTGTPPPPIITQSSATAGGFGVAAITNAGANYFINAVLSAAEERDQAKTISRPSIVTQNNVQGTVMQGAQVPIQTSINNTISVQYVNATLQLAVTPQITDDGNIFMIINVTNNSVGATVSQAGPDINTQSATTHVLVPDGGTVVFGGVTVTNRTKSATYIPLLGQIPVIGHLFKTSNAQDTDQELLFFVSPKILTI